MAFTEATVIMAKEVMQRKRPPFSTLDASVGQEGQYLSTCEHRCTVQGVASGQGRIQVSDHYSSRRWRWILEVSNGSYIACVLFE